jgi:hypothetical protein
MLICGSIKSLLTVLLIAVIQSLKHRNIQNSERLQSWTGVLSTDHELIPTGCEGRYCTTGGVQGMHEDGILPIGQRRRDVVIHSLTANIGQFKHYKLTALFISFFERRMFSRWIVTNITTARGTLHYCKTRIPCGNQLVICGQHILTRRLFIPRLCYCFN